MPLCRQSYLQRSSDVVVTTKDSCAAMDAQVIHYAPRTGRSAGRSPREGSQVGFVRRSISDRQVFAKRSRRRRTAIAAAEKKARLVRATATAVRSLQSGLTSRNREKWAKFASLAETKAGFSLQFRLHGGGRGIRTPGTVARTAVFKTACFNHSHIPPLGT